MTYFLGLLNLALVVLSGSSILGGTIFSMMNRPATANSWLSFGVLCGIVAFYTIRKRRRIVAVKGDNDEMGTEDGQKRRSKGWRQPALPMQRMIAPGTRNRS